MFYLLHGQDEYSRSQALAEMKANLGEPSTSGLNITTLEGENLTLAELIHVCDAIPFLAEKRLVIVHNLATQWEPKRGERKGKAKLPPEKRQLVEALRGYLPLMPSSTRLVFVEDMAISKENPLHRLASELEGGFVKEFNPPRGEGLHRWIVQRAKERGGQIEEEAVEELTTFLGNDLRLLDQEIAKLITYVGEGPIRAEEVRLLVSQVQIANIFSLVDALGHRDLRRATRYLHQLTEAGQAPPYLLFMITRQFRLLLQAKELAIEGLDWRAMQARLGTPAFVTQKLAEQARNFSRQRLSEIHHRLLEAEQAIKTGRTEPELALHLLMVELCSNI